MELSSKSCGGTEEGIPTSGVRKGSGKHARGFRISPLLHPLTLSIIITVITIVSVSVITVVISTITEHLIRTYSYQVLCKALSVHYLKQSPDIINYAAFSHPLREPY